MSTILNSFTRPTARLASRAAATPVQATSTVGVRGLSGMLLAAVVSGLIVLADQFGPVWTDGDLLMGWVLMWMVVFAGLALFAGTARKLAAWAMRSLDGWSRARAQTHAKDRMWEMARTDPRIMADLTQARMREERVDSGFDDALAPMGLEVTSRATTPAGSGWALLLERTAARSRARSLQLYYI